METKHCISALQKYQNSSDFVAEGTKNRIENCEPIKKASYTKRLGFGYDILMIMPNKERLSLTSPPH